MMRCQQHAKARIFCRKNPVSDSAINMVQTTSHLTSTNPVSQFAGRLVITFGMLYMQQGSEADIVGPPEMRLLGVVAAQRSASVARFG